LTPRRVGAINRDRIAMLQVMRRIHTLI